MTTSETLATEIPAADAVVAQLERILSSRHFIRSKRLSEFLRFIVEEKLAGMRIELKEYTIGLQVYKRAASFDPLNDTIVRVEARRMRAVLGRFYSNEGRADPILIDVPKGGYEPAFKWRRGLPVQEAALPFNSVAVLPFEDFSQDRDQRHFCEGITEEIINAVAQLPGIRVASRTSAFAFQGQRTDIRQIGQTLQAEAVLEGSVRKDGNKFRITAQLIDAESGYHLWSRQYDRELDNIFLIQEEIARSIADSYIHR